MRALDFTYDGKSLSEYDFIVCDFNYDSGVVEADPGSVISFSKVSRDGGRKYGLTGTRYESCLATSFDICKDPEKCSPDEMEISDIEFRKLGKWLNRREFLKFNFKADSKSNKAQSTIEGKSNETQSTDVTVYFNASFNLTKLTIGEKLYGVRLSMETDSPFGYGEEIETTLNESGTISVSSDEVGYICPKIEIKLSQETDEFQIKNELGGQQICDMRINNCSAGETITVNSETQIITSSNTSHKIYDDFNYDFFILGNTLSNSVNEITISSPCTVTVKYCPVIKDVP